MNDLTPLSIEYIVLIDTNSDVYKFFNQLCAYCTGFYGENANYNIGQYYADLFFDEMGINEEENPFDRYIGYRWENGSLTPCSIWANRHYGISRGGKVGRLTEDNYSEFDGPAPFSVGIFFDEEPPEELIQKIKARTKDFFDKFYQEVKPEGFRMIIHTKYGQEKDL